MKNFLRKLTGLSPKSLEKGFSLAEAMVAVAVLGIVITATLSQLELSSKSTLDMAADAEINNVTNKIIAAIGTTSVCRANFGTKVQDNPYTFIKDSNGDFLIQKGQATGSANSVKVLDIETKKVSDNEMNLVISFEKKRSSVKNIFASGPKREIPINTILTTTAPIVIQDCFANYDLVIRTAIQQSCKGLASNYNPNINLPYGACEHSVKTLTAANDAATPISCPAGKFLKKVQTTSGEIEYTCGKFTDDCPTGQAIIGIDNTGTVQCDYIFPTCAPGEVLMEIGGKNVCKALNCGPTLPGTQTVLSAFRGFDSTGTIQCTPITTAATCDPGQYPTNITNTGKVTCSTALLVGGACPIGKYIKGVDATGHIICETYIEVPANCPTGFAITGIKDDGTLDCERIDAALRCGGSTKTYNDCESAGGVVRFRGSATISHCEFDGQATCPIGWNRCSSYGRQWQVECRDTANTFYCNQWTQVRGVVPPAGNNTYTDAGLASVTCHRWTGSAGTQGRCDDNPGAGPTAYTTQKSVGCK
jgi:prepilin-type N-terminal cleavage/methylation domain-containing protein